jgi:hypothetical protein
MADVENQCAQTATAPIRIRWFPVSGKYVYRDGVSAEGDVLPAADDL